MNGVAYLILALIMAPALGMAGGMIIFLWNAGIELQPLWVRLTNALVVIVFLRLLLAQMHSDSKVKITFDRLFPAIVGLIIMPLGAGMLYSDPFGFGDGDKATADAKAFMDLCLPYFSLPLNLMFIYKEGVAPYWDKQKRKTNVS